MRYKHLKRLINTNVDIFDYNILVAGFGTKYTIFDYNKLVENFGK